MTDKLTGLMWLKDANCLGVNYPLEVPGGQGEWQEALAALAKINDGTYSACAAGHSDWRLPNRKEFQSLLDYANHTPSFPTGHPFLNVPMLNRYAFWTSTSSGYVVNAPNFDRAWYVSLYDGMLRQFLEKLGRRADLAGSERRDATSEKAAQSRRLDAPPE